LLFIISNINGQITVTPANLIFEDTLSFQPRSSWISLPDSVNNIWEIGAPGKTNFNSGYNDNVAILTDSIDFYSNNCDNSFNITIPWSEHYWGEGILSFYHKFDTDTLQDGGIIEISYDMGNSWINILDDIFHISTNFIGLYEGTLADGNYGFSGKSDGWQYVELYWHWVALLKKKSASESLDTPIIRFRFISDNNNTNKEGWMIDDIIFRGYDVLGNIKNIENDNVQIYPNPSNDYIGFNSLNKMFEGFSFSLFDASGNLVKNAVFHQRIDISDLSRGIYFYRLQKDGKVLTGKVVKN
jgi:hypothetical protein